MVKLWCYRSRLRREKCFSLCSGMMRRDFGVTLSVWLVSPFWGLPWMFVTLSETTRNQSPSVYRKKFGPRLDQSSRTENYQQRAYCIPGAFQETKRPHAAVSWQLLIDGWLLYMFCVVIVSYSPPSLLRKTFASKWIAISCLCRQPQEKSHQLASGSSRCRSRPNRQGTSSRARFFRPALSLTRILHILCGVTLNNTGKNAGNERHQMAFHVGVNLVIGFVRPVGSCFNSQIVI